MLDVDGALNSIPDGYMLGLNSGSTRWIAPYSFAKLRHDAKKVAALKSPAW